MAMLRLTYPELAQRLGRSPDAARMLARRREWQRVAGNDGRVNVLVDDAELDQARPAEPTTERAPDAVRPDQDQERAELRERIARLEGEAVAAGKIEQELRAALAWHRLPWWRRLIG